MSSFGGPTVFVEKNGKWGKYLLPEGKRIENGDKIKLKDCTLIGYYKLLETPKKGATKEEMDKYIAILKRDDVETSFTGDRFLTLIPEET